MHQAAIGAAVDHHAPCADKVGCIAAKIAAGPAL
jgi:hypothetical protein